MTDIPTEHIVCRYLICGEGGQFLAHSKGFEQSRYLLPSLLNEIADQLPERMHLVWSDAQTSGGHPFRAVFGYNASLSLEWGRRTAQDDRQEGGFETTWSLSYADPEVFAEDLDILLHGAVIYRLPIASVDGYRCWIPYPSTRSGGEGYQVTEWQVMVVGLANDLVNVTTDTRDYVDRADIRILPLPPLP